MIILGDHVSAGDVTEPHQYVYMGLGSPQPFLTSRIGLWKPFEQPESPKTLRIRKNKRFTVE